MSKLNRKQWDKIWKKYNQWRKSIGWSPEQLINPKSNGAMKKFQQLINAELKEKK